MVLALCTGLTAMIIIAWLADVNARRAAWRNIARSRQVIAAERATRHALVLDECPYCHFSMADEGE